MDKIKDFFSSKTMKILMKVFKSIIVVVMIAFVLVVCLQRFSNNRISIFKYRMFSVVSGSMAPKYNIGDVLVAKEVEPEDIKVGDTISYLGKVGSFANKVITHKVVEIEKDTSGKYIFHTMGLTNVIEDPDVYEEQVFGIVVYKTFILSLIYRIVSVNIGFYLFIIVPLFIIIGSEIVTTLVDKEAKRREKMGEDDES